MNLLLNPKKLMKILYPMLIQEIMPDQYLMEDTNIAPDITILFHPCADERAKGRIPRQHLCDIVAGHRPDSKSLSRSISGAGLDCLGHVSNPCSTSVNISIVINFDSVHRVFPLKNHALVKE